MKTRLLSFLFALFFSLLLAACGGGGGGGGDAPPNNNQPPGFVLTPLKNWNFSVVQKDLGYPKDSFQALAYHTTFVSCPADNLGCVESSNFYQKVVNTTMESEKVLFGDSGKSLELDPTRYGLSKDFSGCTYSNAAGQVFIPLFPDIPILQGNDFTSPGTSVSGIAQTCSENKKEVVLNFRLFRRDDGIQTVIDVVPVGSSVRSQQHTITRYTGQNHTQVGLHDYGKMVYVRTQ